ncbi:T9SS type A sorting domain-containing protein [candidate division KSB1 bacterium]|nr:T9SS type A sorting domain-containing protein [candidate division KSB1 bacterium]
MKRLMLVLAVLLVFTVSAFAQLWDYVLTGDAMPTKFWRYEGFDNWAEWSFADSAGERMDFVFKVATDPDDPANNVLQCVDLYNLGENVSMAIMTGDRLAEKSYDKATFLFRARCIKPEEVPDSLEVDVQKCRRYLGWDIWVGGTFFQIQFETGEDSQDEYPNWIRAARMWSDSARTRNDVVDKFAWNTFRFTAEVNDDSMGIEVKGYLNEDPEPILSGYYKESYNAEDTQTAFFFGDDRTSGWNINELGVSNGGAKAWFDWVAVAWGEILPPGTPLPLNVKADGPDGNPAPNEGWVWLFDGSENLIEGATNSYTRIAISNEFPGWDVGNSYNNSFMYYYKEPVAIELLYNSMCYHVEDVDVPGNAVLEIVDDTDLNPVSFVIGPYTKGEFSTDQGTVLWRARNLTEEEGVRGRRGWASTANVPGFAFGDIKAESGYRGSDGLRPCTIEFFHNSTNSTGRYPFTVVEDVYVPNAWLSSIGGTMDAFEWHTYRMTWDRSLPDSVCCKLYVDENPIPALENQPWPADPSPEEFGFLFGDQRTNNIGYDETGASDGKTGQAWDYVAVNLGNAYAPGDGDIPEGLIVDKITSVESENGMSVEKFALMQNYPNPFNPATTIRYSLDNEVQVELSVFNVLGKKVKILVNAKKSAGYHTLEWDGTDLNGNRVGSGVYYLKLKIAEGNSEIRKMVMMK